MLLKVRWDVNSYIFIHHSFIHSGSNFECLLEIQRRTKYCFFLKELMIWEGKMNSKQIFWDSLINFYPGDYRTGSLDSEGGEVKKNSFPGEKSHQFNVKHD